MQNKRSCGHEYVVPSVCDVCRDYIEARREARKRGKRGRRIPPLRRCDSGHEWRGFSEACPECARALGERPPQESLRDFRSRIRGD